MLINRINLLLDLFGLKLTYMEYKDAFLMQRRLMENIKSPIIFDIGAYIGDVTAKYIEMFPEAIIYSFEPLEESFCALQKRFESYNSIKPFRIAISNYTKVKKFYIDEDKSCNSLYRKINTPDKFKKTIKVPVTKLDTFCEEHSISKINILKLDIEGGELAALKGAAEKLEKMDIDLIYTEIMFTPHYEGGVIYYDLSKYLSNYGYSIFDFYDTKNNEKGQLRWGNAIFINHKIREQIL